MKAFLFVLLFPTFAFAAPGDAIWLVRRPKVVLSSPEKFELASALAGVFSDVAPGTLDKYYCHANPPKIENRMAIKLGELASSLSWPCRAIDSNSSLTDEEVFDLELNDGACQVSDNPDGSSILVCVSDEMSSDGRILNDAFTQSVFSTQLIRVWDFICERNPKAPSEVGCFPHIVKVGPASAWRIDRKAGLIVRTLGKVAP